MDEFLGNLDQLKACWMTGGVAADAGPEEWRDLDDLTRLALAGQFFRVATRPTGAGKTRIRSDIPALSLDPMPEDLRPLFRRALVGKVAAVDLVRLIAARGYCVNPTDWMPKKSDTGLPSAYEPWRDWLEEGSVAESDDLTAETWDTLPPHSRYSDLTEMHRNDAEAARSLVHTVAPTLAADQRLRMLECLRVGLTEADAEILAEFQGDRSTKVQAFVKTQLARLGRVNETDDPDAVREVSDFLEVKRAGLVSRKSVVTTRKLKNSAQRKRRREVFGRLSLAQLAGALDKTGDELIELWDFGEATEDLFDVIAVSGSDAQVDRMATRAIEAKSLAPGALVDRLDHDRRKVLGLSVLQFDDWSLAHLRSWITQPDGSIDLGAITTSGAIGKLVEMATGEPKPNEEQKVAQALDFLGLLVTRDSAAALVEKLTKAGLLAVDPRLNLLRLNAAL